jgi:hypothetical protein
MDLDTGIRESDEQATAGYVEGATRPHRVGWRVLRVGCLVLLLSVCVVISSLAFALQGGPVNLQLPGSNTLKIGSDDFVLSNSSFKNGTTYFIDLKGGSSRDILQVQYLEDNHSLQVVLHRASKGDREEDHLLTIPLP